jgi:hypothetical protein
MDMLIEGTFFRDRRERKVMHKHKYADSERPGEGTEPRERCCISTDASMERD